MKKSLFTAFAVGLSLTANFWAQVPSYVPTNGLVGWWPFNGNANDESGNGNNGTVNGATLTTDRFGNQNSSIYLNGNSDAIFTSNQQQNPVSFTINIWFKSNNNAGYLVTYTPNQSGTSNTFCRSIWINPFGNVTFYIYSGTEVILESPNVYHNNEWQMATAVLSNEGMKLFMNGVQVANNPNYTIPQNFNGYWRFGSFLYSGQNSILDSHIDDIGIWSRALTQQEISDLFVLQNCSNDLTISPISNSQNLGGNATFTATTSDPSATFAWQSDFGQGFQTLNNYGNYSGANSNALTISNVQLANHHQPIRAISTSGNCVDTSNIATIQIADTCITNVTIYDTLLTTVTDTLIINTTLSLPAPNNENTILIYPNPASDHITIDNGNFSAMLGYSIKIENNAGQQVFQSAINQAQFYVDLSTWSGNGMYFVHLIDPQNNTVTVRKIVLQ